MSIYSLLCVSIDDKNDGGNCFYHLVCLLSLDLHQSQDKTLFIFENRYHISLFSLHAIVQ